MADLLRRDLLGLTATAIYGASLAGPITRIINATPPINTTIGATDIAALRAARHRVTTGGDLLGSGVFHVKELSAEYQRAAALLHGSFDTEALRQEAHAAAATLTRQVAFEFYDLGLHDRARQLWLASLAMGREAAPMTALVVQAHTLESMAHQAISQDQPQQALDLLSMLSSREHLLPPRQQSMLNIMKAFAMAGLGNADHTRRLIAEAEDYFEGPTDERDAEWDFDGWYHRGEMSGIAGRALVTVATHDPSFVDLALNQATASLHSHRSEQVRTKARILNSLVRLHAALGDPVETENTARTAIQTARHLRSPRITGELVAIRPLLKRWHTRPAITEIDHDITTLITASSRR